MKVTHVIFVKTFFHHCCMAVMEPFHLSHCFWVEILWKVIFASHPILHCFWCIDLLKLFLSSWNWFYLLLIRNEGIRNLKIIHYRCCSCSLLPPSLVWCRYSTRSVSFRFTALRSSIPICSSSSIRSTTSNQYRYPYILWSYDASPSSLKFFVNWWFIYEITGTITQLFRSRGMWMLCGLIMDLCFVIYICYIMVDALHVACILASDFFRKPLQLGKL